MPGDKVCNFTMNISSGDPQPIISNVAHWKLLASAHHLIKPHFEGPSNDPLITYLNRANGGQFFLPCNAGSCDGQCDI